MFNSSRTLWETLSQRLRGFLLALFCRYNLLEDTRIGGKKQKYFRELHFLFWSDMGEGRRHSPNATDLGRSFEPAAHPSRFHCVRLCQCFHHGGHFDVDVFRHRGPRLPVLHHLLAVMIPLGHAGGRCAGQRGMGIFPVLHPWVPSWTTVWKRFFTYRDILLTFIEENRT